MAAQSAKTAIKRRAVSAPMRKLINNDRMVGRCLDYGCGHGFDCDHLDIFGYDPYHRNVKPRGSFDTITCTYVLNVIESPSERDMVLRTIRSLLSKNGKAYITVRNDLTNLNGYTKIETWQGKVKLNLPILYKNSGFITYVLEKS
jgi:2-polyprenyl-3-methyl-5-hydroxy-6-metoxy-1,4-benzoquinol methylase